jgi:hypothetical protein
MKTSKYCGAENVERKERGTRTCKQMPTTCPLHEMASDSDTTDPDEIRLLTPSPPAQQDDSHDEYTPSPQSIRSDTVWVTPSQRSNTSSIAANARTALDSLYKTIYGQDSIRCLLTLGEGGLNVAHAVRRASKSPEVSLVCSCC